MDKSKECFNRCPKCDADEMDIEWGSKDWEGTEAWQEAVCKKCGCEFVEIYEYYCTKIQN